MPPKLRSQPEEGTDQDKDQGAIGGAPEASVQPAGVPSAGGDAAITALAHMFESFMRYQRERDERQERETARREQHYKVLSHQVNQMQLDMERTRVSGTDSDGMAAGVKGQEPRLARLEDTDDIEHFLTTFERLAEVYQWPRGDWAIRLIPLLTGKARSAFVAMNPSQTQDYDQLKQAILKKYEISTETYRLRFRSLNTPMHESPQELYTRLKDLFCKWVQFTKSSKDNIMEAIVLEQYLRVLHPEVRTWVKERNPTTAAHAANLVEVYIAARRGPGNFQYAGVLQATKGKSEGLGGCSSSQGQSKILKSTYIKPTTPVPLPQTTDTKEVVCYNCGEPGHTRPHCPLKKPKTASLCYVPRIVQYATPKQDLEPVVTVLLNGKPLPALVDTGCAHTLVEAKYVPRDSWREEETVTVCCVHGDSTKLPTAEVYIEVHNQPYLMKFGVAQRLPYPILLGTDLPVLVDLVQETWCGVVTRAQARQQVQDTPTQGIESLQTMPFYSEVTVAEPKPTEEDRLQLRREHVETLIENTEQAEVEEPELSDTDIVIPNNLAKLQNEDPTLADCFRQVKEKEGVNVLLDERFVLKNGLLYRESKEDGKQLVVPKTQRREILDLGHSIPWAGHLGFMKTLMRIAKRFYWPRMYSEVKDYCKTCPECQLAVGRTPAYAPLIPLPVVDYPFERIGVDIVGPLERSQAGNRFILVICDYATRYPEAYPLREVTAKQISTALLRFFSQVGIPREVLTDQGPNFMSHILHQVYQLLGIKRVRTTPYHPQTDGLVERFNQTLKSMLKKFVSETGKDWDKWLPFLLFAYREVPQASTGFSPFELLYAHHVRGPLDVLKESWEDTHKPSKQNILTYVLKMREQLQKTTAQAQKNLLQSQAQQKVWYDKAARTRSFQSGEQVLLLLPTSENRLLAKWQGPYEVKRKVGPVTYEIEIPSRSQPLQVFHINMLKKWHSRKPSSDMAESTPLTDNAMLVRAVEEEEEAEEQYIPGHPGQSELNLDHLNENQKQQLMECIPDHLFMDSPGRTDLIYHSIILNDPKPIRQPIYHVPERLLPVMKEELETMQTLGVIEPSTSEWSSPIVLVPKKDGTLRFCLDFRKLNSVSKFDPYPMPRVDELVERLGRAKYLSTLDLCKGYWQVPLKPECKELTAFKTPFGHFQFRVLPFGLHGAPATFQRMMDQILQGTEMFAAAYLDDIIIFSQSWEEHLRHLQEVLKRIKTAGLTIRPDKCALAKAETQYLGYVLGHGVVRPQVGKIEAIKNAERPVTKKQVRSFLGLVGWYRRFVPNFSARAVALTNLTKKCHPNKVNWTMDCERAFQDLKDS